MRDAALNQYGAAYERLAELEQVSVARGQYDQAQAAHALALSVLKAYTAEQDDPKPRDTCRCAVCHLAAFRRVT
jgi:hypothetical protein